MNVKDIVEKWYKRLSFNPRYDEDFYAALDETDLSDLTVFEKYDAKGNTASKNLLACLYFCEDLEIKYNEKGISKEILENSLRDLVLWNDTHYAVYGKIGLMEFPWLDRTFLMQIFRLGRLQFCMFPAEHDIEEISVKEGDPIIEVHIPASAPLRYEDCEDSFETAKVFFEEFYPDYPRAWCTCHSWLLDDGILALLGEKSNIAKFQTFFAPVRSDVSDAVLRYTFKWNTTRETLKECVAESGFAKRLKDAAINGQEFHEVLGIRKLSD